MTITTKPPTPSSSANSASRTASRSSPIAMSASPHPTKGTFRYKLADNSEPWNLRLHFMEAVERYGGIANHHAHFDKAYLINMENLRLSQVDMQKKWEIYRYLKETYTHDDLVERISRGLETMIQQGVTYCRTMVDADS